MTPPSKPARKKQTSPDNTSDVAPTEPSIDAVNLDAENQLPAEINLPVLPLRGETLFPISDSVHSFVVGREKSVAAIEEALSKDRRILVIGQQDPELEAVVLSDLYEIGTEASIVRMLKLPDGTTSVLVEGEHRVRAINTISEQPFLRVVGWTIEDLDESPQVAKDLMPRALDLFHRVVELSNSIPEDSYIRAINTDTPGSLADVVAASLPLIPGIHQEVLEIREVSERLALVIQVLEEEIRVLELEQTVRDGVRKEVEKDQRELILRKQLRTITKQLGEPNAQSAEIEAFRKKLNPRKFPTAVIERGLKDIERLGSMPQGSPEASMVRSYLEWLTELPWKKRSRDTTNIRDAARILASHHHGLDRVKERLLEYIAVRRLARNSRSPILCFVGPPGVGKTSLGRSIAEALSRKFVRVSLGGVRDEAEIRGHRMTYIGSMPGRILQMMRRAGTVNPVFMIDEVDKLGMDFRGDPSAALLEVLDPEQNHAFSDHYMEIPYDLSRAIFIATANTLDHLPPALVDRMEVIDLPGYVEDEKVAIAEKFLVEREIIEHGLEPEAVKFTRDSIVRIIREYTQEAGVRGLTRAIATIVRKHAVLRAESNEQVWEVGESDVPRHLGPAKFRFGMAETEDTVAVATAVFNTPSGGDLAPIEVVLASGTGKVELTGLMGDVMQESAHAALTYARAHASRLGYREVDFTKQDVHVHVPSGSLPKEGPSAGLAMAIALISALTRKKVRHDVILTGEITLQGRVLPVGSIKAKVLAAHRAGIGKFVMPKSNRQDLIDLPEHVRKQMDFVEVADLNDALSQTIRLA